MFDSKYAAHAFWAFCGIYPLKTTKMPRGNHIVCSFNRHVRSFPCYSCIFFIHHMQHVKQTDYYSQSFPCFFTFNSSKKLPGSAFSRPGSEMPCGSRCRIALMFACWGDPGDGFGADGIGGWDSIGEDSLWLWLTVRHGFSMAHWNRGWPVNSMVIFHGELLVITRWYLVRSTNAWIYPLVI